MNKEITPTIMSAEDYYMLEALLTLKILRKSQSLVNKSINKQIKSISSDLTAIVTKSLNV